MERAGADACLITSNVNLFYTIGQIVMGYLYIPLQGNPILFVRRPEGLSSDSIVYVRKPEQMIGEMKLRGLSIPERIMLEGDYLSHSEWLRYGAIFQTSELIDGTQAIRGARSIKTAAELELIRYSGVKHASVYKRIPELYRTGMSDLELSIEIEYELRKAGSLGIFRVFGQSMEIFMGSILSGDNAGEPSPYDFALGGKGMHPSIPIGADGSILKKGTSLMVDMGGNFNGYMTDMTRTYSIGKLPDKAYRAHQAALEIQDDFASKAKPGTICEDIYNQAMDIARKNGLDNCFMGVKQQAKFIGHGVGIEINELPVLGVRSRTALEAGMVLAVEPKFVIEGVGAVGIENTFAITGTGTEKLTILEESIIDLE